MDNVEKVDKIVITESAYVSHDMAEILNQTAFLMPNWKWLLLVLAIIFGLILRYGFQFALRQLKKPLAKRFPDTFTGNLFRLPVERPVAWSLVILLWLAAVELADWPGKLDLYLSHVLKGFLTINIIVLLYYAVDALQSVFINISSRHSYSSYNVSGQLIPYAGKFVKVIIVVLGVLTALQSFGLNVMSLLAGLGLGGLALALAAQDTAANLFGSIAIMFDNPFKVGDHVKVKDVEGIVEEIGFRSTRIRTFYNSVITIPNAMIAKETIDNMGVRPARRLRHVVSITYETPPDKVALFCMAIKEMIQSYEKVTKESVVVTFNQLNQSSLDILVNFHLRVFTGDEENATQEEILIKILKIGAEMKIDFAYPTTTNYQRVIEPPIQLSPEKPITEPLA